MTEASNAVRDRTDDRHVAVATPEDDERVRSLIRVELDRQHALPVARRTLELLAEAGVEPAPGEPGYRVIDRDGDLRLKPVSPEAAKKGATPQDPLTLSDLVVDLRERHPELFGEPPPPEPEPVPEPEPHATLHDTVAQVRAAGARFVETQSTLAKSLAATSAEKGRALAAAAGETVEGWRTQLDERLKTHQPEGEAPEPQPSAPPAPKAEAMSGQAGATLSRRDWRSLGRDAAIRFKAGGSRFGEGIRGRFARRPEAAETVAVERAGGGIGRRVAIGLSGLAAFVLVVGLVTLLRQDRGQNDTAVAPAVPPPQAESSPPTPTPAPKQTAQAPASQETPPAQAPQPVNPPASQPADAEEQPDDAPARNPNEVAGVPEVVDTATLRIGGKVVRLFGVEWVRGAQAEELTKYLAKRPVSCQPAPGSSGYFCMVNGRDLSEVVLFNGGGRASSEAGPELVAAEDHARSERLGVWKK